MIGAHRVRRMVVELKVPTRYHVAPVRAAIRAAIEKALPDILRAVDPGGGDSMEVIRIGRAEIDLGVIDFRRLETEIFARLQEPLAELIKHHAPVRRDRPAGADRSLPQSVEVWLRQILPYGTVPAGWRDLGVSTIDAAVAELLDRRPESAVRTLAEIAGRSPTAPVGTASAAAAEGRSGVTSERGGAAATVPERLARALTPSTHARLRRAILQRLGDQLSSAPLALMGRWGERTAARNVHTRSEWLRAALEWISTRRFVKSAGDLITFLNGPEVARISSTLGGDPGHRRTVIDAVEPGLREQAARSLANDARALLDKVDGHFEEPVPSWPGSTRQWRSLCRQAWADGALAAFLWPRAEEAELTSVYVDGLAWSSKVASARLYARLDGWAATIERTEAVSPTHPRGASPSEDEVGATDPARARPATDEPPVAPDRVPRPERPESEGGDAPRSAVGEDPDIGLTASDGHPTDGAQSDRGSPEAFESSGALDPPTPSRQAPPEAEGGRSELGEPDARLGDPPGRQSPRAEEAGVRPTDEGPGAPRDASPLSDALSSASGPASDPAASVPAGDDPNPPRRTDPVAAPSPTHRDLADGVTRIPPDEAAATVDHFDSTGFERDRPPPQGDIPWRGDREGENRRDDVVESTALQQPSPMSEPAVRSDQTVPRSRPSAEPRPIDRSAWHGPDEVSVPNAGLVVLWPFIGHFFRHLELVQGDRFVSPPARHRAVGLLMHVASGDRFPNELESPLARVLCHLPFDQILAFETEVTEREATEGDTLLQAVIAQAPTLRTLTADSLRGTFLLRPGVLSKQGPAWKLQVNRKDHDIVLERVPWSYQWVRLPWMTAPIEVMW